MIEAVTFDWWGTIAMVPGRDADGTMRELRISRVEELLRGRGVECDRAVLYRAYDQQGDLLDDAWANQRELTPSEQIQAFLQFAGFAGTAPEISDAVADAFGGAILARPPSLFPHIREVLRMLKGQGFAIGLISNTGRSWGRYLTRLQGALGIQDFFDVRVYSDELRMRKPDAKMFEAALREFGCRPEEAVHIGDDVTADIAAAKAVGMHAVWFNTGFWPGAATDRADGEIRDHADLPQVLEALR